MSAAPMGRTTHLPSAGLVALAILMFVGTARADDPEPGLTAYTMGLRIGGYGFREVDGDDRARWSDCRMNGIGVFGERSFTDHLFLEAGVDLYFASGFPTHRASEGMDRVSGLLSLAAGARMFPDAVITPYAQLGTGLEVTRVSMQGHSDDTLALPLVFVGLGADINIGSRFRAGLNIRAHMMGHFSHSHAPMDEGDVHGDTALPAAEMELAAQMQFYAKYRL